MTIFATAALFAATAAHSQAPVPPEVIQAPMKTDPALPPAANPPPSEKPDAARQAPPPAPAPRQDGNQAPAQPK